MPRDLSYTPKLPHELDELAAITPDDLLHAEQTADRLATPKLKQLLDADATGDTRTEEGR